MTQKVGGCRTAVQNSQATHPSAVITGMLPGNVLLKGHFLLHFFEAQRTDCLSFTAVH